MARRKQVAPLQRIHSGEVMQSLPEAPEKPAMYSNGHLSRSPNRRSSIGAKKVAQKPEAGLFQLLTCVGGIYASFLTWGLLQERITTTAYHPEPFSFFSPAPGNEYWTFPVFLNAVQAFCAFISGTIYLVSTTPSSQWFPSRAALRPLLLVALTSTLASPFGYASLAHVDYLTFVLAKSCKLLPVMVLHIALYQKSYKLSKYAIVLAVTTGVAVFTLYHPPKSGKAINQQKSSYYGLSLLAINLLFDGLTNTTQDHIFSSPHRYGRVSSAQMMSLTNLFATILMTSYLLLTPLIPQTLLPAFAQSTSPSSTSTSDPSATHEFSAALSFLSRNPQMSTDILLFSASGAIGQLFIFRTLALFSSLLLVTVTVTRKMLTMVLSVVWYGKSLTGGQWAGVGLVFGGIGMEGYLAAAEKREREREKQKTLEGKLR